jgi:hypothetical protein
MTDPVSAGTPARRTRRQLLAGGSGTLAAVLTAGALARPAPAYADNGNPVILGQLNDETSPTIITNSSGGPAISGFAPSAFIGVQGVAGAAHFPVARMRNGAGYYVLPTESYDAVALTRARFDMRAKSPDYLMQNLNRVYNYKDPRAYPLASYSYVIMPKAKNDPWMQTLLAGQYPAKWQTLASFLRYSICRG